MQTETIAEADDYATVQQKLMAIEVDQETISRERPFYYRGQDVRTSSNRHPEIISLPEHPGNPGYQTRLLMRPFITMRPELYDKISTFLNAHMPSLSTRQNGDSIDDMIPGAGSTQTPGKTAELRSRRSMNGEKSDRVFITGCIGTGKTCVLLELGVRAVNESKCVRVVDIDQQKLAPMSEYEQLEYFVTAIKRAFCRDGGFNEAFRLNSTSASGFESTLDQVLRCVHSYCCDHITMNVPLKVLYLIDNYDSEDQGLVRMFMRKLADYNDVFFVAAAVENVHMLTESPYELPMSLSLNEAHMLIEGVLIPSDYTSLANLWRADSTGMMIVIAQRTNFNPLEMAALFAYISRPARNPSAGLAIGSSTDEQNNTARGVRPKYANVAEFARAARNFISDHAGLSSLPNLNAPAWRPDDEVGSMGVKGMRENVFRAFNNLRGRSLAEHDPRNLGHVSKFDRHPYIRAKNAEGITTALHFSAPRIAEYSMRLVFHTESKMLVEMSNVMRDSNQDLYDMGRAGLQMLFRGRGVTAVDSGQVPILHRLRNATGGYGARFTEITHLMDRGFGSEGTSLVMYADASSDTELNSMQGLDFISQDITEGSFKYMIVVMAKTDSDMRMALQQLCTKCNLSVKPSVPVDASTRVGHGMSEVDRVHAEMGRQDAIRVYLFGTSNTVRNVSASELRDPGGIYDFELVDIGNIDELQGIWQLQQ